MSDLTLCWFVYFFSKTYVLLSLFNFQRPFLFAVSFDDLYILPLKQLPCQYIFSNLFQILLCSPIGRFRDNED